jgi:hypothetical protein
VRPPYVADTGRSPFRPYWNDRASVSFPSPRPMYSLRPERITHVRTRTLGGSSPGGAHALHRRGRVGSPRPPSLLPPLAQRYIETFNRRDWAGISALLEDDVRCELVGFVHLSGRDVLEKRYLSTYGGALSYAWRFASGAVNGEPAIICLREDGDKWVPRHAVRLDWREGRVARIRDYAHVPYLFREGGIAVDVPFEYRAAQPGGGGHVES